jgi:phosphohistidine phosphatase
MQIIIMRHGEAQMTHQNDRDRQLTTYGTEQSRQTAQWLNHYLCDANQRIEFALVSPFKRAQQTFRELNKWVDVEQELSSSDIVPSGDPDLVQAYIDDLINEKSLNQSILLVSHMPLVSYLLDTLCNVSHSLLFATAALVIVDYDVSLQEGVLVGKYVPEPV